MFLGLSCFSEGILTDCLPLRQSYNYIEVDGAGVGIDIDAIHVEDYEIADATILTTTSEEAWGINSIILAQMENTLECGSLITSVPYPLTKYIIRRKEVGANLNPTLVELTYDRNLKTYKDYTPRNNIPYIYGIYPYFSDGVNVLEGRGLLSLEEGTRVSWFGWTLSDASGISATPTQYLFDMEIESSEINVITDMKKYDNYTTYPTFRKGNRQYREFSFKTIPYSFSESTQTYTIDVTLLDALKAFINDSNVKLIRNSAGEAFYVVSYDFSYKYHDTIPDQPYVVNFKMTEVAPPV